MSAVTTSPQRAPGVKAADPGHVTLPHVLRSEWTKLWSLRSTRWSLLAGFVAMVGLGPLIAAVQMSRWSRLHQHVDSISTGVGGWHLAQLAIGVLGVLVISGEYTTGMIRSSLMAVPRRLPVLWAKLLVFGGVTFVLMLVASLISFLVVQAIDTQHHVQHSLSSPGALRAVIGAALFLTALSILCVGLGTLLRNTAGGIAAFVGLLFVLPGISAILPSSVNNSVSPYLPLNAGTTLFSHDSNHLAPWTGFGVFCAYAAAAVVLGAVTLMRKDA